MGAATDMMPGHIYERVLPGFLISVYLLTYGRARIGIGPVGASWYADEW
jgi:hypothetical protein